MTFVHNRKKEAFKETIAYNQQFDMCLQNAVYVDIQAFHFEVGFVIQ